LFDIKYKINNYCRDVFIILYKKWNLLTSKICRFFTQQGTKKKYLYIRNPQAAKIIIMHIMSKNIIRLIRSQFLKVYKLSTLVINLFQ